MGESMGKAQSLIEGMIVFFIVFFVVLGIAWAIYGDAKIAFPIALVAGILIAGAGYLLIIKRV